MAAANSNDESPPNTSGLIQVERICDDFEDAWKSGSRPRIEEFLERAPKGPGRSDLFVKLLDVEVEQRRAKGEQPVLSDYLNRFPGFRSRIEGALQEKAPLGAAPLLPSTTDRSTPSASRSSALGSLPSPFGRYELLRKLGKGGMGSVYLARDSQLRRLVALKVPHHLHDPETRLRFQREAQAAASIRHPNICMVYDCGEVEGRPFVTMDYLEGETLADMLARLSDLPRVEWCVGIVSLIAQAMTAAHNKKVIHRDLKPSNIMIQRIPKGRRPVVMDFGLARDVSGNAPDLTCEGVVLGTPAYMSPEQVLGSTVGPASDIYSLGMVLYQLLAGRLPFEGQDPKLWKMKEKIPPPPSCFRPDLDPSLDPICLKALAHEVGDRYPSMEVFAGVLAKWIRDRQAPSPPPAAPRPGPQNLPEWIVELQSPRGCPCCDGPPPPEPNSCPQCGASRDWIDLLQATYYCREQFRIWTLGQDVSPSVGAKMDKFYEGRLSTRRNDAKSGKVPQSNYRFRSQCWDCGRPVEAGSAHCPHPGCGVPLQGPEVRDVRQALYLENQIRLHQQQERLDETVARACLRHSQDRLKELQSALMNWRPPIAARPIAARPTRSVVPPSALPPLPAWAEILTPRNIHILLISGGLLMWIGLLVWVASRGTPLAVSIALGLGNATLLGAGWVVIGCTPSRLAGRALTLLACLVMPLNLWFYSIIDIVDKRPLVPMEYLWIAAMVCTALYVISAWLLQDEWFVPVLVAGVAMTGLLILAPFQLLDILTGSTLLAGLGLLCLHVEHAFPQGDGQLLIETLARQTGLHVEHAFPQGDGPFTRQRFGRAFFWSGQVVLAGGLALLLSGWLLIIRSERTPYVLLVTLGGVYGYFYSTFADRRRGPFLVAAILTLLWAEALTLQLFPMDLHGQEWILCLSGTALLLNLLLILPPRLLDVHPELLEVHPLAGSLSWLLNLSAAVVGIVLYLLTKFGYLPHPSSVPLWFRPQVWTASAAVLSSAVAVRLLWPRVPRVAVMHAWACAGAVVLAGTLTLNWLGLRDWIGKGVVLALLPMLGLLIAQRLAEGREKKTLYQIGQTVLAVLLVAALLAFLERQGGTVGLALLGAEACLCYVLAVFACREHPANVYLATAAAYLSIACVLYLTGISVVATYLLAGQTLGLLLLLGHGLAWLLRVLRLEPPNRIAPPATALAVTVDRVAHILITAFGVALALMAVGLLAASGSDDPVVVTVSLFAAALVEAVAAALSRPAPLRRGYFCAVVGTTLLACLHLAYGLNPGDKVEIIGVAVGLLLLLIGHVGWYYEESVLEDYVTFCLWMGSLAAGIPLLVAVLGHRWDNYWYKTGLRPSDEVATVAVSVLMLVTGLLFRLKATTIAGSVLSGLYLLLILGFLFARWEITVGVGFCLLTGGGLLFLVGLILSLFRDQLLEVLRHLQHWR